MPYTTGIPPISSLPSHSLDLREDCQENQDGESIYYRAMAMLVSPMDGILGNQYEDALQKDIEPSNSYQL